MDETVVRPASDVAWQSVKEYEDITYHKAEGIARIAFDRPEVRNAPTNTTNKAIRTT